MSDVNILIVEDDPQMLEGLTESLAEEGYEITSVLTGKEAIEKVKKEDFDVVLTDLVMPGLDGMDVLKEVKRTKPRTHVVMITAFATIENAVDAMKNGASDYISKPFKIAEVQTAIKRLLEEARFEKMIERKLPESLDIALTPDSTIKSLSNPIRRGVIELLDKYGKVRFTDIKKRLGIEDATKLSFHLRVLKSAGMVDQDDEKKYFPTTTGRRAAKALRELKEDTG
ncbi:MAG: response regulator [Candidatus Hydrothermarchaeales archaeon]